MGVKVSLRTFALQVSKSALHVSFGTGDQIEVIICNERWYEMSA